MFKELVGLSFNFYECYWKSIIFKDFVDGDIGEVNGSERNIWKKKN